MYPFNNLLLNENFENLINIRFLVKKDYKKVKIDKIKSFVPKIEIIINPLRLCIINNGKTIFIEYNPNLSMGNILSLNYNVQLKIIGVEYINNQIDQIYCEYYKSEQKSIDLPIVSWIYNKNAIKINCTEYNNQFAPNSFITKEVFTDKNILNCKKFDMFISNNKIFYLESKFSLYECNSDL